MHPHEEAFDVLQCRGLRVGSVLEFGVDPLACRLRGYENKKYTDVQFGA